LENPIKTDSSEDPYYNSYLHGMIDDFRIFDRALSADEIKTLASVATRVNDSDPGIHYSSGWSHSQERDKGDT